jgi:hypothetical protein
MGHRGKFVVVLWATVANLVLCCGLLVGFDYALLVTSCNEAIKKKSFTISLLWTIALDLILR